MKAWRQILAFYGSFIFFLLVLAGALGSLYSYVTGTGGRFLLAVFLIMLLTGITMFARERARRDEFFLRHFGGKEKSSSGSKSRKHKRMGKKCPQCERVIHHRRSVCQHCGYEFPSKKYKESRSSAIIDSE